MKKIIATMAASLLAMTILGSVAPQSYAGGGGNVTAALTLNGIKVVPSSTGEAKATLPEGTEALVLNTTFKNNVAAVAGQVVVKLMDADYKEIAEAQSTLKAGVGTATIKLAGIVTASWAGILSYELKATDSNLYYYGQIAMSGAAAKAVKVVVGKPAVVKAKGAKKAKVTPNVTLSGKTHLVSAKMTITKGKKTVAKNKTSVQLAKGTYKVKTTVSHKTWTIAYTPKKSTSTVTIKAGESIPLTCSVGHVFSVTMSGSVLGFTISDLMCTSDRLKNPIKYATLGCSGNGNCSDSGISFKALPARNTSGISATYTPSVDVIDTIVTGGDPIKKLAAKAKTITKTHTVTVK